MGLDVSHDAWSGPYSAFSRFRESLAKAAGIPLNLMEGFYPPPWGDGTLYQPVTSVDAASRPNPDAPDSDYRSEGLEEFVQARPEFAKWRAEAKERGFVERRYIHPYVSRDGKRHDNEHVEIPSGPPVLVPQGLDGSLEWARAKGPDGPDSHSYLSTGLERYVVEIAEWLPLSWDLFPFRREPLSVLLNHSDCDGSIYVRHQMRLAERLEEIAAMFEKEDGRHPGYAEAVAKRGEEAMARGLYDGTRAAALRFAAGCRRAYAERKPLRFG